LPVILYVRIEDRHLVRLLQHLDFEIPKDVGHRIEQTLVVRIRECLARPRDFAELLDDLGSPRLQDRTGGIADQLIEVALAGRRAPQILYRARARYGRLKSER